MIHGTVRLERQGSIARVVLARPEIRNAFNDLMLADLLEAFGQIKDDETIRVVILTGEGKAFCAGADLNWMKRVVDYTYEENYEDSLQLARMLREIYCCPKPVIGRVNGHAIGGGTGVVAACDITIGSRDAVFAFTETKLGLTPAAISPYLLKRMGERNLRQYFLTGERFTAEQAVRLGLLNSVAEPEGLDAEVEATVKMILSGGPHALEVTKRLIEGIGEGTLDENGPFTAEVIARLRMSDEGQDGMNAFLEKRKPKWISS